MRYDPKIQVEVNNLMSRGKCASVGRLAKEYNLSEREIDQYISRFNEVAIDQSRLVALV